MAPTTNDGEFVLLVKIKTLIGGFWPICDENAVEYHLQALLQSVEFSCRRDGTTRPTFKHWI
jgi:hypothetical protein